MTLPKAVNDALRRLHAPGVVAGLDVGQRRDACALVSCRHATRRTATGIEHRWLVVDAWQAPAGTRAGPASLMIADRLAGSVDGRENRKPPGLVVDATGAGDAWVDALVAGGVTPTMCVVVAGASSSLRWGVDQVEGQDIARVSAPRHPGGSGEVLSILGALEAATSIPPEGQRPAIAVAPGVADTEAGRLLRQQLGSLAWRAGRPDHEEGGHDDLAFALALAVWASSATPAVRSQRVRTFSVADRLLPLETVAADRYGWAPARHP